MNILCTKKAVFITATLLSTLTITSVFAADGQSFYGGIDLGSGRPGIDSSNGIDKKSSFMGGAWLGYPFTENFAVEGQITTLGKVTDLAGNTAKANAVSLTGVGFLPVNEAFSLYGKLGVAETKTSVSDTYPATNASRFAPTIGIGAQYSLTSSAALRLGWDHYGTAVDDTNGNKVNSNANTVTVGVAFKF